MKKSSCTTTVLRRLDSDSNLGSTSDQDGVSICTINGVDDIRDDLISGRVGEAGNGGAEGDL